MELQAILDWYDRDQRRDAVNPGARREATSAVIRHVALHEPLSYITYSSVTVLTADDAIQEQIDYFAKLGHSFEWTAYSHDSPTDLKSRLLRHGFEPEEPETILVLELESMGPALFPRVTHEIRRIREVADLADVVSVNVAAKGAKADWDWHAHSLAARLKRELQEIPDRLSVYVAYCDGVPASSGWIRFDPASPFASLWGGSTLPEFRKRGLYTALVATRAQEARERGARFLTVDAQSLSRPILEKLGFRVLTVATPMVWRPPPTNDGLATGIERRGC